MFSILVYFLELNLFKFFMKENDHICVEYEIPKIPCVTHLSFVKEKQQMLKKRNIPFLYYAILFLLSNF